MTLALRSRPRVLVLMLVLALVAGAFRSASQAEAQQPTGASATKDCPDAPLTTRTRSATPSRAPSPWRTGVSFLPRSRP